MGNETLITGVGSGLGRYLFTRAGSALGLTRDNASALLQGTGVRGLKTIIHCAFGRSPESMAENVTLTERLLDLPHERFVLISSCDVDRVRTPAAETKAICEKRVNSRASRPLILRATSLLGTFAKPNNLSRLLHDAEPVLTLTAGSSWNIILHEDVWQFADKALLAGLTGTHYLASASSIRVDEVASRLGKTPRYGEFTYDPGDLPNETAVVVHESFGLSSWEQILRFLAADSTETASSRRESGREIDAGLA